MDIPYYRAPKPDVDKLNYFIKETVKNNFYSNGPLCRELEDTIRDMHGTTYALLCGNCSVGLTLALQAVKELTGTTNSYSPSFTWGSTTWALENAGMGINYLDISRSDWMLEEVQDEKSLIVPVSVFGAVPDTTKYEGYIVIDAAHSMGTPVMTMNDNVLGAVISLAPTKLITGCEGGVFLTDDLSLATKFDAKRTKFSRLSEFHAAMALSQWGGFEAYLRDRKNRYKKYQKALEPVLISSQKSVHTNYTTAGFRIRQRDSIRDKLAAKGIETRAYFEPVMRGLPESELLYSEIICLPNWYGCPTDKVVNAIKEAVQ